MKITVKQAMYVLITVAAICEFAAVMMVNDVRVGIIITTGILAALMVGYTYICAVKKIVTAAIDNGTFSLDDPL